MSLQLAAALNPAVSASYLDHGNSPLQEVEEGQERTAEMTGIGLLLYRKKNLKASQTE